MLFVALFAAMAFVPAAWIALPVLAFGVFGGLARGPRGAYVADLVPAGLRGTAYGLFNASLGLATLYGNLGFGLLWERYGARTAFLSAAACALAGLATLAFVRARSWDPRSPV